MVFFKIIQTSTTGLVQTFGRYTRTVQPGLRFHFPLIQKITPISNRLRQESFDFEVKTKDNVFTNLGLAVQYRIHSEDSSTAYFSLDNPHDQLNSYIENVVRSSVPKMNLDQLFEAFVKSTFFESFAK
jgi:regulator of protease activity HflC (stomatin/prohibitin superfamily)